MGSYRTRSAGSNSQLHACCCLPTSLIDGDENGDLWWQSAIRRLLAIHGRVYRACYFAACRRARNCGGRRDPLTGAVLFCFPFWRLGRCGRHFWSTLDLEASERSLQIAEDTPPPTGLPSSTTQFLPVGLFGLSRDFKDTRMPVMERGPPNLSS